LVHKELSNDEPKPKGDIKYLVYKGLCNFMRFSMLPSGGAVPWVEQDGEPD
jgi:hypothetical protein